MASPVIIKEGFWTRLHSHIEQESSTKDYTYDVLLEERTGSSGEKVKLVVGRYIVAKAAGQFVVYFGMTSDAEPYSHYKTLQEAKEVAIELDSAYMARVAARKMAAST